jgi:hypothetical protein
MPFMPRPSPEAAKELADELAGLSKQQSNALKIAAYINMSQEESDEYERRRKRIGELCELLGRFKPKPAE